MGGAEDVEVHPLVHRWSSILGQITVQETNTGALSSFHQPGASSRSLDPTGRLCCLTRTPPRTPEAPAAAPSPSLLTHLNIKRLKGGL